MKAAKTRLALANVLAGNPLEEDQRSDWHAESNDHHDDDFQVVEPSELREAD